MSSDAGKIVNKAIREILAPILRSDGFKGTGRKYHRVLGEVVHLFQVQGSRYSPSLAVNLGVHLQFLGRMAGSHVDPPRLWASECFLQARMTEDGQPGDQWWNHDGSTDSITSAVMAMKRAYAERWRSMFDRLSNYPASFAHMTPENLGENLGSFGILAPNIALARIRLHEGNAAAVIAITEQGMKDCRTPANPSYGVLAALHAAALKRSQA
jgi:hypothetical protein